MSISKQLAKHFRDLHFGGNWTSVNLKETLSGVSWQQATIKVHSCNTIAALVFHINYYVSAVLKVLHGEKLDAHDKYSFDHPSFNSKEDWEIFLEKCWTEAKKFADLVEQLPDSKLEEDFEDGKYGTYYRNIAGIIEHSHYHLGQIVLIRKIISLGKNT
jgi:hypothetical protein